MAAQEQTWQDAVAEIWRLFRDTDRRFKETDRRFKETEALLERRFLETNVMFRETDKKMQETDRRLQETDRKLRQLISEFGSQWGRLIEALVESDTLRLFQERGIEVRYIHHRTKVKLNGRTMELDLLLENDDEVVVIEAKSQLKVEDVDDFLRQMDDFLEFFPRYRGYRIYGGVAGLGVEDNVARYAYRKGLFVLTVGGEGLARILNDESFRPRDFGAVGE